MACLPPLLDQRSSARARFAKPSSLEVVKLSETDFQSFPASQLGALFATARPAGPASPDYDQGRFARPRDLPSERGVVVDAPRPPLPCGAKASFGCRRASTPPHQVQGPC